LAADNRSVDRQVSADQDRAEGGCFVGLESAIPDKKCAHGFGAQGFMIYDSRLEIYK
jgi:hypothetical protein